MVGRLPAVPPGGQLGRTRRTPERAINSARLVTGGEELVCARWRTMRPQRCARTWLLVAPQPRTPAVAAVTVAAAGRGARGSPFLFPPAPLLGLSPLSSLAPFFPPTVLWRPPCVLESALLDAEACCRRRVRCAGRALDPLALPAGPEPDRIHLWLGPGRLPNPGPGSRSGSRPDRTNSRGLILPALPLHPPRPRPSAASGPDQLAAEVEKPYRKQARKSGRSA